MPGRVLTPLTSKRRGETKSYIQRYRNGNNARLPALDFDSLAAQSGSLDVSSSLRTPNFLHCSAFPSKAQEDRGARCSPLSKGAAECMSEPSRPDTGCSLENLAHKEATARKLIFMMEAMGRRQLRSATKLSTRSPVGPGDSFDEPSTRPSTRNGRPLTGSLFDTPASCSSQRGRETALHHHSADGTCSEEVGGRCSPQNICSSSWIADNQTTLDLYTSQKFTKAYVCTSALIAHYKESRTKSAILRSRRGMCSFALMNYQECIEDFQIAYRLLAELKRRNPKDVPCVDEAEMMRMWIKALIMREDYVTAGHLYSVMIEQAEAWGLRRIQCHALECEKGSLEDIEQFRNCVSLEQWDAALMHLKGAKAVIEDTPLRTAQAVAYLETNHVDLARETLLPYLPLIPLPLRAEVAADVTPEERQLRSNVEAHYLLSTVLLAKASVYSGRQYMDIAAALTQRCLLVHPRYPPAIRIGNYLLSLEESICKIDTFFSNEKYGAAVDAIDDCLKLDPSNDRICAMLLTRRGEARLQQTKYSCCIADCTSSLKLDPSQAKSYFVRSKAFDAMQMDADAAADRAMAIQLNAKYEDVFNEEMARRAEEVLRRKREKDRLEQQRRQAYQPRPPTHRDSFSAGADHHRRTDQESKSSQQKPIWARKQHSSATLYDLLGVPSTAGTEQIRHGFKKLTLQCHPDKMVGESEENQLKALEMFKRINHAHSILCDSARRAEYDLTILVNSSPSNTW